jgi:hypothetical protein
MLASALDLMRRLLSLVNIRECLEVTFIDLTRQVDRDRTHNGVWSQ